MAKICGFISSSGERTAAASTLTAMAEALVHGQHEQVSQRHFNGGGMAVVSATRPTDRLLASGGQRETYLALAGSVLGDLTDSDGGGSHEMDARGLLRAYDTSGSELLGRLDGDFAFACYDERNGTLNLAGSRFGYCPLYYYADASGCWFASEVKALLSVIPRRNFDWEGAADFYYLGHMLGDRTLIQGVNALAAGEELTYSDGKLKRAKYYDFTKVPLLDPGEVSTRQIGDLFTQAVQRRLDGARSGTLLLSGGMDSRFLLAVLRSLGARPNLISLEHSDEYQGADGRYANQIARHLGFDCEVRPPRPNFYSSRDCLEVFYILDGMTPTWDLWIPQVYPELTPSLEAVWDGLALGTALAGQNQRSPLIRANMGELLEHRTNRRHLLRRILTPDAHAALDASFLPRLHAEFDQIPAKKNQYVCFRIQHRSRRRMGPNTHQLYVTRVEPRTPGTDSAFLEYVLRIPIEMKQRHQLYLALVKEQYPELLAVPIISGGSPLETEPRSGTSGHELIKQMRATVGRTSGRLNIKRPLKRLVGQTPRPVEGQLAELIIRVMGDSGFTRPFYNSAQLRRMFDSYRTGNMRYHDLFALVFYLELWHLLFIDGNAPQLDMSRSN